MLFILCIPSCVLLPLTPDRVPKLPEIVLVMGTVTSCCRKKESRKAITEDRKWAPDL